MKTANFYQKRKTIFLLQVCGIAAALLLVQVCSSCVSQKPIEEAPKCSRDLAAAGIKSPEQLAAFFVSKNPEYPKDDILLLATLYVEEGRAEGINSDVAFVQMCLETGYLRFGRRVTADMHNYCGLGAMSDENPGERFETPQLGVRAHIQHLHAYATNADVQLKQELVDTRYAWVHKAKTATTVFELSGQWAPDTDYGDRLNRLLTALDEF